MIQPKPVAVRRELAIYVHDHDFELPEIDVTASTYAYLVGERCDDSGGFRSMLQRNVFFLFHQRMNVAFLPFRIEIAVTKDDVRSGRECRVFRPASYVRKKRIADVTDDQSDNLRAAGDQPTSKAIRAVMELGRHLQHPLPSRRIHSIRTTQRPGRCGNRQDLGFVLKQWCTPSEPRAVIVTRLDEALAGWDFALWFLFR